MWPNVVQFETRQLQLERELQLTHVIAAAQVPLKTASIPSRARRLRLPALPRLIDRSLGAAKSRS
jgi:hypothetical protein